MTDREVANEQAAPERGGILSLSCLEVRQLWLLAALSCQHQGGTVFVHSTAAGRCQLLPFTARLMLTSATCDVKRSDRHRELEQGRHSSKLFRNHLFKGGKGVTYTDDQPLRDARDNQGVSTHPRRILYEIFAAHL